MWAKLVRVLAPMAVNAVAERVLARRENDPRASNDHHVEDDSRIVELQNRLNALSQTQAHQIEELRAAIQLIGQRASIALWCGVASVVATLVVLIMLLVKF